MCECEREIKCVYTIVLYVSVCMCVCLRVWMCEYVYHGFLLASVPHLGHNNNNNNNNDVCSKESHLENFRRYIFISSALNLNDVVVVLLLFLL